MNFVFRKVLFHKPRILFVTRHCIRCLEWSSWLCSKRLFSCTSTLFNTDNKDDAGKEDPFELLWNSRLLAKKQSSKNTSLDLSFKLPTEQAAGGKHLGNYFYEEFIKSNCSDNLNHIVNGLSENIHLLSSEQLIKIVKHLHITFPQNSNLSKQFILLIGLIDKECCTRSSEWKTDMYLQAAWSFFQLKSFDGVLLQKKAVSELAGEICHMKPQELVSYLTIVKQFRKFPDTIDKEKLETRIYEIFRNLSIEDLGIICLAFFECNLGFRNQKLVGQMAERLVASAASTDEKTVGSMLKLFRKSTNDTSNYAKQVLDLQPKLLNHISEWGPKVLMQLVAVGSNLLYFHPPTIESVLEKFLTCMNEARLKDVERLAMAIAISCHQSPNSNRFWGVLESEFTREERRQEISQYPNALISLVNYAVVTNQYLENLLKLVLHPDFVKCAKGMQRNLVFNLDSYL